MAFALITGASKGIGKAIAHKLAASGYNLLLVARNEDLLQQVAAELMQAHPVKAHYRAVDLSLPHAAQDVFNWCAAGQYDVAMIVNNAGYGLSGKFETYALSAHLQMMQVNMNAVVELTYL